MTPGGGNDGLALAGARRFRYAGSMRRLLFTVGCAGALLAGGCASSDLSRDTDLTREVVISLPPETPAPTDIVKAVWFPNANGFKSTDTNQVHVSGVLVLAGERLWFMAWNDHEHAFDMLHDIAFLRADKVGVDHFGTSAMLVIQSGNDSFDSFQLMGKGSFNSDPGLTQALGDKLAALRARNPQTDP